VYIGAPVIAQEDAYSPLVEVRLKRKQAIAEAWEILLARLIEHDRDVLIIEDDIEVRPDCLRRLQTLAYERDAGLVSGWTRTDGRIPAFHFRTGSAVRLTSEPDEPVEVDAVGGYCYYLRRDALRLLAPGGGYVVKAELPDHQAVGKDMHLCWWLRRQGVRILLDPATRCNHWVEAKPGKVTVNREIPQ